MENFDFGIGIGILALAFAFVLFIIKTIIGLIIIHYLTKKIVPTTARFFGFENKLTGISRYDFFAFEASWLFTAPIVFGLFEIFLNQLSNFRDYSHFGSINISNYYLLSLTIWSYNSDFEKFIRIPIGKIIMQGIVYLLLTSILSVLLSFTISIDRNNSGTIFYLYNYVINSTAFGLLTIYYIKKNGQTEIHNA